VAALVRATSDTSYLETLDKVVRIEG
ncbi:uncharacterized protein METZ01_LOCUS364177, partial [marine metagenome]